MRNLCFLLEIGLFLFIFACSSTGGNKMNSEQKAWTFVNMANGAISEGDYTGALQNLKEAETLDPDIPEVYHSRAVAFYFKHDLDSALQSGQRALEIKPEYVQAHNTVGKILMDQGRYEDATPHLKRAAQDPLNREAFKAKTSLGVIDYRKKNLDQASEWFNSAIEETPSSACVAYYYRGHIHLQQNDIQSAIRDYGFASKNLCGNFSDAHLAQAMAYERAHDYKAARKKYLEVQNLFPSTKSAEQALIQLRKLP